MKKEYVAPMLFANDINSPEMICGSVYLDGNKAGIEIHSEDEDDKAGEGEWNKSPTGDTWEFL